MTRIKFCGMTTRVDVEAAQDLGVHAIGFVREVTSPRFVTDQQVSDILAALPTIGPFVSVVNVFGVWKGGVATFGGLVQASEFEAEGTGAIWAVRAKPGEDPVEGPWPVAPSAILLDAFVEGQMGGTGQRVDWSWAAEVVQRVPVRVILAGGLTPDNVAEAIRTVRPYAVDVSSGIEVSPGVKDRGKMRAFVEAVRSVRE